MGKQREQYKMFIKNNQSPCDEQASCALTEERVLRLNQVGFRWIMGKGQYGKIHGIFDGSENMVKVCKRFELFILKNESSGLVVSMSNLVHLHVHLHVHIHP